MVVSQVRNVVFFFGWWQMVCVKLMKDWIKRNVIECNFFKLIENSPRFSRVPVGVLNLPQGDDLVPMLYFSSMSLYFLPWKIKIQKKMQCRMTPETWQHRETSIADKGSCFVCSIRNIRAHSWHTPVFLLRTKLRQVDRDMYNKMSVCKTRGNSAAGHPSRWVGRGFFLFFFLSLFYLFGEAEDTCI